MKQNGMAGLIYNAFFLSFILAPLVVVMLVAFTDKGFISMPFDGASLRWFRAILENGDIVAAFWLSVRLAFAAATIGVLLAVPAALAIARYRFPGRAALSCGASRFTAFRRVVLPMIRTGVAGGWVLSFIQSFDELTMTIFVATPGTTTLPVAMYNQIAQTIDPLVASVSAVLIVGTVLLMVLLDRMVGLDRILIGEAQ